MCSGPSIRACCWGRGAQTDQHDIMDDPSGRCGWLMFVAPNSGAWQKWAILMPFHPGGAWRVMAPSRMFVGDGDCKSLRKHLANVINAVGSQDRCRAGVRLVPYFYAPESDYLCLAVLICRPEQLTGAMLIRTSVVYSSSGLRSANSPSLPYSVPFLLLSCPAFPLPYP